MDNMYINDMYGQLSHRELVKTLKKSDKMNSPVIAYIVNRMHNIVEYTEALEEEIKILKQVKARPSFTCPICLTTLNREI